MESRAFPIRKRISENVRQIQPTLRRRFKPVGSHAEVQAPAALPPSPPTSHLPPPGPRGPSAVAPQPAASPGSTAPGRSALAPPHPPPHLRAQPLLHQEGALLPDSSDSSVNEPARGDYIPAARGLGIMSPQRWILPSGPLPASDIPQRPADESAPSPQPEICTPHWAGRPKIDRG